MNPYRIGANTYSLYSVKVDLNSNARQEINAKNLNYNISGKTIAQYGTRYREWSGSFQFDNNTELSFLRNMHLQRLVYFRDETIGTDNQPTLVYWSGIFSPKYDETNLQSGSVPFKIIEVGS